MFSIYLGALCGAAWAQGEPANDEAANEPKVIEVERTRWRKSPLVQPIITGQVFTAADDDFYGALKLGGSLGLGYEQDGLAGFQGNTRVQYTHSFGPTMENSHLAVGTFIGPKLGPLTLDVGADYYYDQYYIPNQYEGSFSAMALPIRALFDIKLVRVEVAAGPIFFLADHQGVRESLTENPIGFGDEFFYMVNADVGFSVLSAGAYFSQRKTAYGDDNSVGVKLGILSFGGRGSL